MNPLDFVQSITKLQEIIKNIPDGDKRKENLKALLDLMAKVLVMAVEIINKNGDVLLSLAGQIEGVPVAGMNFSLIENYQENKFTEMEKNITAGLQVLREYNLKKQEERGDCKVADIKKNEDGSVNIKFKI